MSREPLSRETLKKLLRDCDAADERNRAGYVCPVSLHTTTLRSLLAAAERVAALEGLVNRLNDAVVTAQLLIAEKQCPNCFEAHEVLMRAAQPLHNPVEAALRAENGGETT